MNRTSIRPLILLISFMALAAPAFAGPPTLVGSWTSVATDDVTGEQFQTLWTFHFGRTLVVSGDLGNASTGHGAWKRTGLRTFEAVNTAFLFAPDGSLALVLKNRATFELTPDGDHFTAVAESELQTPDGTVVDTTSSAATGERIRVP